MEVRMDRETMREAIRQSAFQLFILIFVTFVGLVGISYILEPESVTAFFFDLYRRS